MKLLQSVIFPCVSPISHEERQHRGVRKMSVIMTSNLRHAVGHPLPTPILFPWRLRP